MLLFKVVTIVLDQDEIVKKTLEENEKAMKEMQLSYEEKLAQAKATVKKLFELFFVYL